MKTSKKRNKNCQESPIALERSKSSIIYVALIISAAGLAAYANSFHVPFIFDDIANIVDNPTITDLRNFGGVFLPPVGSALVDRPVVNFTFALNHAVSGYRVWSYHAFNLAVHIIAALTLFGVIRRTLLSQRLARNYGAAAAPIAFAGSIIWLLHPVQTQAVTYISQRFESLMAMFFLMTLYCAIRNWDSPSKGTWKLSAWLAFLLGAGSKEVMVMAPFVVLAYEWIFVRHSLKEVWINSRLLYAGYGAGILLLGIMVMAGGTLVTGLGDHAHSHWLYWQTQPEVILYYIRLFVWPYPLCFDYGWPMSSLKEAIPWILTIMILLLASLWLFLKKSPLGFLLASFFLILAPTSLMPLKDPLCEYRVYLPAALLSVIAVMASFKAERKIQGRFPPGVNPGFQSKCWILLLLVVVVLLGAVTYARNGVYGHEISLWADTVMRRPQNPRAQLNLGMAFSNAGKITEATDRFREAIRLNPQYAEAYGNMGGAMLKAGKYQEAMHYLNRGLELNPDPTTAASIYSNMGIALFSLGAHQEAMECFRSAIHLYPRNAELHMNIGIAWERSGRLSEAAGAYEKALGLKPQMEQARRRMEAIKSKRNGAAQ